MYLKELTAAGFKSFASPTRFRFEPGITAIVGPNGSGKSNVVDALAWVMGEQGAKSLRGGNMADVIFAGGTARPALGRAHVELTIDNSDGRLPIAYSEVTISRTMFRSGGSEYAINRQPVRLLDVQELLSDSGLGRQMHVIVGQGQLDTVLSASPTDRRAFIDEAAGVAKYRRRKERALRKLESMDANLVRVLDLTEEMRSRLRPLARQAKAARDAAGVRHQLAYSSARLLADDLVTERANLTRDETALIAARDAAQSSSTELTNLKEQQGVLATRHEQVRQRADFIGERYRDFTEQRERFASVEQIAEERAASAQKLPATISASAVHLALERAEEASQEAQTTSKVHEDAQSRHREAREKREILEPALVRDEQNLARAVNEARLQRTSFERLTRAADAAALSHEAAVGQEKAASDRLTAAQQRFDAARLALDKYAAMIGLSASDGPAPHATDSHADPATAYELAARKEQDARDTLSRAEKEERAASEELSRLRSRRETLQASLSPAAEDTRSSRNAAKDHASDRGIAELLKAPPLENALVIRRGWEEAVTALLGSMLTARILPATAFAATVDHLPHSVTAPDAGTAGIVAEAPGDSAKDSVASGTVSTELSQIASSAGVMRASDVVEVPDNLRGAVEAFFVDAWLCETVAQARSFLARVAASRDSSPSPSLVATKSGTVVARNYVRFRGQEETSRLGLRADLAETEQQEEAAVVALTEVSETVARAHEQLKDAVSQKNEALTQMRAADAEAAKQAQEHARLSALAHAAQVDVDRIQRQVEEAHRRIHEAGDALKEAQEALPESPPLDEPAEVLHAQEVLNSTRSKLLRARDEENEARLNAHVAHERAQAAARTARAFATQANALREDRRRQIARQEATQRSATGLHDIVGRAREGIERADQLAREALEMRTEERRCDEELRRQIDHVTTQIAALETRRVQASETLLQLEVSFASQRAHLDTLEEKARLLIEDYGPILNLRSPSLARKYDFDADGANRQEGTLDEGGPDDGANNADKIAADALIASYGPHFPWQPEGREPNGAGAEVEDELPAPTPQPYSRTEAERTRKEAERALTRLGVVNPLAIEEYEAASARYTFLQEQVDDLNRSKADLLDLIREVDTQVKEAFSAAFVDTARHFEETFATLFPGGIGRLELTDPEDPLTTGVEIYARPSGKKVTRLSLLSGGERSLAALAYLIAIFEARPSPFYVLDEIEAALDDINLGRVLTLLGELREESQLLVITHQKRTMEFADALYGISMKDGVSAVMSHRMHDR